MTPPINHPNEIVIETGAGFYTIKHDTLYVTVDPDFPEGDLCALLQVKGINHLVITDNNMTDHQRKEIFATPTKLHSVKILSENSKVVELQRDTLTSDIHFTPEDTRIKHWVTTYDSSYDKAKISPFIKQLDKITVLTTKDQFLPTDFLGLISDKSFEVVRQ